MQIKATLISISLILPFAVGCGKNRGGDTPDDKLQSSLAQCNRTLQNKQHSPGRTFQSCEQIHEQWSLADNYQSCVAQAYEAWGSESKKTNTKINRSTAVANSDDANTGGDLLTNVRHAGVDEADFVKVTQEQFFIVGGSGINVVDRKTRKLIGTLALSKQQKSTNSWVYTDQGIELLATEDKLLVLDNNKIAEYDIIPQSLPRFRQKRELNGRIVEARLINNRVVLVLQEQMRTKQVEQQNGLVTNDLVLDNENCSSFYPALDARNKSASLTRIETFPVSNISELSGMNFLGNSKLYMTDRNIYLFPEFWHFRWHRSKQNETSFLRKIPLNADGSLGSPASGEVKGRIKDVWALSELASGELAVATTTGYLWDNSARNHFSVLAEKDGLLRTVGETPDYGAKEDIRSVRFVGNIAYVVTFKKTDPLYAIDTSDPSSPEILGELKIPGFSTYMHPLNQNHLIGLGFDALEQGTIAYYQGLQLSLFDVSNPKEMLRTAVKIFGTRGSSSIATNDHKAFFLDVSQGVLGFPVLLNLSCKDFDPNCARPAAMLPASSDKKTGISGAALVKIEGSEFGREQFISNADLLPRNCIQYPTHSWWESPAQTMDVQRILKIDGDLISISRFGLKVFRWGEQLETLHSVRWINECQD